VLTAWGDFRLNTRLAGGVLESFFLFPQPTGPKRENYRTLSLLYIYLLIT